MSDAVLSMFTKLIVDDEEKMTAYYTAAYGLTAAVRVAGDTIGSGEAFREVIMTRGADMASGTLVMLKFTDRPKPRDQQVILGFVTADLEALKERIVANGGRLVGPTRDEPDHGVRVQFSEDPEGALAENVQML
jgi:predicted enzyme related to lactoylglutathione lyase